MALKECFLLLSLLLAFSAVSSQADSKSGGQDDSEYNNGAKGPANWGSLQPESSTCTTGSMQSPIAIYDSEALLNQSLELTPSYDSAIVNLTKGLKLDLTSGGGGSLYWNNYGPYKVVEMHWHTPSEHTIDGISFPLEGHIVHQGPNEEILVRAIFYKWGTEDPFINNVMQWESGTLQVVNLPDMKSDYFNYMGSLTTPPCTEGVTWIVHNMMLQVSPSQLNFFLEEFGGTNARPLQPLNDRIIYKHNEDSSLPMLVRWISEQQQ